MKRLIFLSVFSLLFLKVLPQETSSQSDTLRKDALNIFMDASDYIRKEIPYVNYVRDIKDARVYIISTSQRTGSGGIEFTYFLVGQHEFEGMRDTVSFVTTPDETTEGRRQKEVNTLKMGLMRYVAKTPLAKYMRITFSEPLSETVSSDKWNSWVFKTSLNGYLNGQKTYKSNYISGNLSASRITEDWKINLNARYYKNTSKYIIDDSTVESSSDSKYLTALIVKSLSDHWSVGGSTAVGSSSYSNKKLYFNLMPGIEYDLFPYSESTRRQLRILYSAGVSLVHYTDTTIYDKIKENLWLHTISASYEVVQKWGSIDFTLTYSNYFHDWSKNNLSLDGYLSLRVAKGLNVTFGGGASLIHDQLNLVKQDLAYDEILLRRKELATQYQYFTSFGFTYTFGSIYNNVVNPRFGNSGSGGMMIIMN
ncbi:MAG TPA: hypothetical protein VMW32_11100 [Bacteroidales bacterium]|nr:hypothetical protein [Bacteroidales bacterium]